MRPDVVRVEGQPAAKSAIQLHLQGIVVGTGGAHLSLNRSKLRIRSVRGIEGPSWRQGLRRQRGCWYLVDIRRGGQMGAVTGYIGNLRLHAAAQLTLCDGRPLKPPGDGQVVFVVRHIRPVVGRRRPVRHHIGERLTGLVIGSGAVKLGNWSYSYAIGRATRAVVA